MTAEAVKSALWERVEPGRKAKNEWFFKTGYGQYSEYDQFIGVRVPDQRTVAKMFKNIPLTEVKKLMMSPVHEHRLTAAMLLTYRYNSQNENETYEFYTDTLLSNTTLQIAPNYKVEPKVRSGIDNWDIVDSSAHKIIGRYLADKDRNMVYRLADHPGLWQNRAAIISTWWFIAKLGEFTDTLTIAEQFMTHSHDLMHKATGWMLREVGKKNQAVLQKFLDVNAQNMPRTMLRYSIERLNPDQRTHYMRKV